MAETTVKTRVLIISDTHSAPLTAHGHDGSPFRSPLPNADLLIHCGDLTMTGGMHEYHETLDMLREIDAPVKLVIAGNHDLSLDRDYMVAHEEDQEYAHSQIDKAKDLWTAPDGRAVKEGVTYLREGVHQIQLPNGAHVTIYASPYTPEFYDWGFPYARNEDRFNPPLRSLSDAKNVAPYPVPSFSGTLSPIDILLTHGPPYGRLDKTDGGDFAGCPSLLRALIRSRPLLHCFGHIHEGWGAERIAWSDQANHVTESECTISAWRKGAWKAGVAGNDIDKSIEPIPIDTKAVVDNHAVFFDVSNSSQRPLRRGRETLLVNAAIMDIKYKPTNAPWLVDLELPKAAETKD